MAYKNHRDLIVWQKAMLLTQNIYKITKQFPQDERYGLVSQMQRSATSIPSNIAEGGGRETDLDFDRFLRVATGSGCELDTQIELAYMNGYINALERQNLLIALSDVIKLIYGLRKSLKIKMDSTPKH